MARVEGFEPAKSGQTPVDDNGNPVAVGVFGDSTTGVGVFGTSGTLPPNVSNIPTGIAGVEGHSIENSGVTGRSIESQGVLGRSVTGNGILGVTFVPSTPDPPAAAGVFGSSTTGGNGVVGFVGEATGVVGASVRGTGVRGTSGNGDGVQGETFADARGAGVRGRGDAGVGVFGTTATNAGVVGTAANSGTGVSGAALKEGTGVGGLSVSGTGVRGDSLGGFFSAGVLGASTGGFISAGVFGTSSQSRGFGIFGRGGPDGWAGFFDGKIEVAGPVIKSGGGFKIDHPLEPARKYLSHSFVESPEMKNVYDGVVSLDANGACGVELPEWFEALNRDFRYQLTALGEPAPNLHIAREISNNRFNIAGGKSGMKVSWQVTGIRKDAWAQAHPLVVEEEKSADAAGHYRHPELYGLPPENSTVFKGNSELRRRLEEQRGSSSKEVDQLRATDMAHLGNPRARLEEEWRRVKELVQRA
jgi:hypothetical protein